MDGPSHAWEKAIEEIDAAIASARRRGHGLLGRGDYGGAAALVERLRSLQELKTLMEKVREKWVDLMTTGPEPRVLPLEGDWAELSGENPAEDVVGGMPEGVPEEGASATPGTPEREDSGEDVTGDEALTPQRAYRVPILRILHAHEGGAPVEMVLAELEEAFNPRFTPRDLERTASNPSESRWRNSARWCRKAMVRDGLLKANSPRGRWEITESGVEVLGKEASGGDEPGT